MVVRKALCELSGPMLAVLVVLVLSGCGERALPRACEDTLKDVTQLVVVLTDAMDSADATIAVLQRRETNQSAPWTLIESPYPAVVGRAGLGWGNGFEGFSETGDVVKREGDERSPAGIYRVGPTFGFDDAPWPGHIALKASPQVCVDDLKSAHYGKIISRRIAGAETSAEDMAAISVYKRGIIVDYPPSAMKKSGSCIFFHIWQEAGAGTAGCIASEEARIADLQNNTASVKTAVVIWAKSARARFEKCLPELPVTLFESQKSNS